LRRQWSCDSGRSAAYAAVQQKGEVVVDQLGNVLRKIRMGASKVDVSLRRRRALNSIRRQGPSGPRAIEPAWPLPRGGGLGDDEIREAFGRFRQWHYAYAFDGGLEFAGRGHGVESEYGRRPRQRFRHFMSWVLDACGGSLAGKRVLDIACNSGFWSMQCALLGAGEVVGFDARDELIDQANLLKSITGVKNARFVKSDFWSMTPEALGGQFDVVLNLGLLYRLAKPVEALEATAAMSRNLILLDTAIHRSDKPVIRLQWETSEDIRDTAQDGMVVYPSGRAIDMMLRHLRFPRCKRLPNRSPDLPTDYLVGRRASWLIHV